MKLIDYDKHRTEIQRKVMVFITDPNLTVREATKKIMELLDSLPADYTEAQMKEVDWAYQRVCKELEEAQREAEERGTIVYVAIHRIITGRIEQIQALLSQYPDCRDENLHGRLDELHMTRAECEKMAAELKLRGKEKSLKQ